MQKVTTRIGQGEGQKMKIKTLGPNSIKFCMPRRLKKKKLTSQRGGSSAGIKYKMYGKVMWMATSVYFFFLIEKKCLLLRSIYMSIYHITVQEKIVRCIDSP